MLKHNDQGVQMRDEAIQELVAQAEAAVKLLCELSRRPYDNCDVIAQRLGFAADRVACAQGIAEFEDPEQNWRACLSHLLNVRVEAWRSGTRMTVGQVISDLWALKDDMSFGNARIMLAQVGLGIVERERGRRGWWLAVPNQNPFTRGLFEGSKWAGDIGAGVWAGALRQSPRPQVHDVGRARINGDMQRVTLIALSGLYGPGGVMMEESENGAEGTLQRFT